MANSAAAVGRLCSKSCSANVLLRFPVMPGDAEALSLHVSGCGGRVVVYCARRKRKSQLGTKASITGVAFLLRCWVPCAHRQPVDPKWGADFDIGSRVAASVLALNYGSRFKPRIRAIHEPVAQALQRSRRLARQVLPRPTRCVTRTGAAGACGRERCHDD